MLTKGQVCEHRFNINVSGAGHSHLFCFSVFRSGEEVSPLGLVSCQIRLDSTEKLFPFRQPPFLTLVSLPTAWGTGDLSWTLQGLILVTCSFLHPLSPHNGDDSTIMEKPFIHGMVNSPLWPNLYSMFFDQCTIVDAMVQGH